MKDAVDSDYTDNFKFSADIHAKTLVKRIIAMILLRADVPVSRVTEISGVCDRSVRGLRKSLADGKINELLTLKNGTGSRSETMGLEKEIIAEVEKNNYHTRQQIADMISDTFTEKHGDSYGLFPDVSVIMFLARLILSRKGF